MLSKIILNNLYLRKNLSIKGKNEITISLELKKIIENNEKIIIKLNLGGKPFKIIELRRKEW